MYLPPNTGIVDRATNRIQRIRKALSDSVLPPPPSVPKQSPGLATAAAALVGGVVVWLIIDSMKSKHH